MENIYKRKVNKSLIPTCNIMGVNIAAINMEWLVSYLNENLEDIKGDYICVSNVHTTVTSYEDASYCAIQNGGLMAIPDGGPYMTTFHAVYCDKHGKCVTIGDVKIYYYDFDKVTHVELPESARKELDERFVLIYTGQRRLARNLLRDVVGRYVGNEPDSLFALEEIQKTAALMRFELERGNVDGFAKLLDYHWELSKKVDAGSSNTLIEQIFSSIEEMIDGRLVCGAGGGGFLQVILKKGITREDVEKRLNEVFMDSLVGVADCKLVW